MGTTYDELALGDGSRGCFVLCVGGYNKLITDHPDPSAILAAGEGWDGLSWSSAISGLRVEGAIRQSFKPWSGTIQVGRLNFVLSADRDTGGEVDELAYFHAAQTGNETDLLASIDADDASMTVEDQSDFAASGDLFIGAENIGYGAKVGVGIFNALSRGQYEPFSIDGGTDEMGREHKLPDVDQDVHIPLSVRDAPRHWSGRNVGLWYHRINGDVIDTRAQAELVWAGRLTSSPKDTSKGETVLTSNDARVMLRDCVLHRDQFVGVVSKGLYLLAGWTIDIQTSAGFVANPLVVTVGAAGADEIEAGMTSLTDLLSAFNRWLAGNTPPVGEWHVNLHETDGGLRVEWGWIDGNTEFAVTMSNVMWQFLGANATGLVRTEIHSSWTGDHPDILLPFGPYQAFSDNLWELEWSQGTWFQNTAWLPQGLIDRYLLAGNWGIIEIGGIMALAKYASATTFDSIHYIADLLGQSPELPMGNLNSSLRYEDNGEIKVRQIAVLAGSLVDIVARIFASTGATGYNHATYDAFPAGLGAGVPWELLGDEFLTSLENLQESSEIGSTMLVLETPTKLQDRLTCELNLRNAFLVMKGGHMVFQSLQTAIAAFADHTLDETSKGVGDGIVSVDRTPTEVTQEHSVNIVKLEYNRNLNDEYQADATIKNFNSIEILGDKPVTIRCPNSFADASETGDTIRALAGQMAAYVLPAWSMPLAILRRSINFSLWLRVAPGDVVLVTDSFARDPATGERGLSSKPAVILAHGFDFGGGGDEERKPFGEVTLTLPRWGSPAIYSPAAEIDFSAANAGYVIATKVITCEAHEYSEATEDADATHFVAGDKVLIHETDPDDPAVVDSYSDTVASQVGNTITITTGMAAWDNTKHHRVVSDDYSTAVASQQADSYQADKSDMKVQDLRGPYDYGDYVTEDEWTAGSAANLPERYAEDSYGDGIPLSVSTHDAMVDFVNNYISYKSARQQPFTVWDGSNDYWAGPGAVEWQWLGTKHLYVGPASLNGITRKLSLAVAMQSTAGDQVECRITLSYFPPGGDSRTDVTFKDPKAQLTFVTSAVVYGILASQEAAPVYVPWSGWGFLSVELRASAIHGSVAHFHGLVEDFLQEIE